MQNEVLNPFGNSDSKLNAVAESGAQREAQEVQAMMVIAKKFPRNEKLAVDRILNSCTRKTLAESALYSYARGGTDITGPSIRLAEALAQGWGNIQYGVRELENRGGESTIEAFAWDIETNTRVQKVFQVAHKRFTRKGSYSLEDPRDIYEMVANQGARRLRSCILGVIPGDVVETAVKQCEVTLKASADVTPEGIKKMLEKFEEIGVNKLHIESFIQRRVDSITPAQVVQLRKIFTSLKDGMSSVKDWFEVEEKPLEKPSFTEPKKGAAAVKDKIAGKAGAK